MSLKLKCSCGAKLNAPTSLAGKQAKCKSCGHTFLVPANNAAPSLSENVDLGGPRSDRADGDDVAGWLSTPISDADADWLLRHRPEEAVSPDFSEGEIRAPQGKQRCESCGRRMPAEGVVCLHCGYHSRLRRRLETIDSDSIEASKRTAIFTMVLTTVLVVAASYVVQKSMDGPMFLSFYFVCLCVIGVLVPVYRKVWVDSDVFNYAALFMLLGIGAARIAWSISQGGSRFAFLVLGMVAAAAVLLWTRTDSANQRCDVFASPTGGMGYGRYAAALCFALAGVGAVYFVPAVSGFIGEFGFLPPGVVGLFTLGGLFDARAPSSGSSGGFFGGCTGGGCGGGGCGGGCGGCGG